MLESVLASSTQQSTEEEDRGFVLPESRDQAVLGGVGEEVPTVVVEQAAVYAAEVRSVNSIMY